MNNKVIKMLHWLHNLCVYRHCRLCCVGMAEMNYDYNFHHTKYILKHILFHYNTTVHYQFDDKSGFDHFYYF